MPRRRWRFYETAAGRRPVRDFLDDLSGDDLAAVLAAMRDVARHGLAIARHVRGDIYEVREDGNRQTFRILFSALIELAERRLADWRGRARPEP